MRMAIQRAFLASADSMTNENGPPRSIEICRQGKRSEPNASREAGPRVIGRRLWLICALLVAATFTTGAVVVWQLRQSAFARAEREITNLGVVLAEQTSRTIQSVDLVLAEVALHASEIGEPLPEGKQVEGQEFHRFLADHLHNLPQVDAIALVDSHGTLLNWSRDEPVPKVNFSDRDYFRYLQDDGNLGAGIGAPGQGRITGKWIMVVARRINGPGGEFLGLVVGLIDTQYLEDFYRTISMVSGESVTVLRSDGVVIAGYPDIAERRGKHMPPQSPWYDRVANGGGSYTSPGFLADFRQIITVHPVRDYPLVVDSNVSEQAALKSWYTQAIAIVVASVGIAVGFTVLFAIIIAQFRRQEDQNARLNRSEAALRASERKSAAYAEMSADWFWEQDADLRFSVDSRIPLTSRPTDVGKTRWDLGDPSMDQHRWDEHKAGLAARRPFRDFRWERIRIDGKRRYMSTSGDPIFDDAGIFLGYHGTGRDITVDVEAAETLRLEKERAEAANRAKSEFLGNMSHELRTPLHAIIGFSELIRDRTDGSISAKYVAWAGEILDGGRHLLSVINDVLDLSRIEADRYDVSDDKVDLAVIARACRGTFRLQAEANEVRIDCDEVDAAVLADRRAIKQIVLHLLSNAMKFTSAGGRVTIRAEQFADGGIALAVADTGVGIDPVVLALLCQPFTQADSSISRTYSGTGLGLAISRKLAVLHGGVLTIESAVGRGTTVRVTFPAVRVLANPRHRVVATVRAALDAEQIGVVALPPFSDR
jgi:signal transduction histidine kinase